jgi:hypothetical protein
MMAQEYEARVWHRKMNQNVFRINNFPTTDTFSPTLGRKTAGVPSTLEDVANMTILMLSCKYD